MTASFRQSVEKNGEARTANEKERRSTGEDRAKVGRDWSWTAGSWGRFQSRGAARSVERQRAPEAGAQRTVAFTRTRRRSPEGNESHL